jgi:tripartite ATP-independent transporter DctP family solute receptor
MRRFVVGTLVLALVSTSAILSSCARDDGTVVLKLAHVLDPSHSVHQGMVYMAERLDEYSGGTMRIDIYPSGQLGAERELVELVQIGSLAMTKVSAAPLEAFVPAMQVFSIPYVFRDRDHLFKALDSEVGRELLDSLEVARLKGMGYYDSGSRSFYMVDTPVEEPADIGGKKIRVMKSQTAVKMIAAMGGSATPIAWGELYTALQQGVVDGAENNPPSFYLSGHYEVSKYYALNEHTSVPDMLLMSMHVWDSLSEQQQAWLQKAVDDSVAHQRELWRISTEEALAAVRKAGVTVTYPDKAPFMKAVAAMKASYDGTEVGRYLRAIEAVE